MNKVISINRCKKLSNIMCSYCDKLVERSTWTSEASHSWWCYHGYHGPLFVKNKVIDHTKSSDNWIEKGPADE